MGTTTRFGLPYRELTDSPDIPGATKSLAEGVEAWLGRAIPCLSTARPGSPPDGMMIRETDTGLRKMWDGSTWVDLAGGVAETLAEAQFASGASVQTIPNITLTPIAFGSTETPDPNIVRSVRGSGHQFALTYGGRYTVSATVRYAANAAAGERYAGLYNAAAPTLPLIGQGGSGPNAVTCSFSVTKRWAPGTVLFVAGWQDTGAGRALEPSTSGLGNVRINLTLVGP